MNLYRVASGQKHIKDPLLKPRYEVWIVKHIEVFKRSIKIWHLASNENFLIFSENGQYRRLENFYQNSRNFKFKVNVFVFGLN